MQGGDLGTHISKRIVVVMEPLLVSQPEQSPLTTVYLFGRSFGKTSKMTELRSKQYELNTDMLTWVRWMGREHNVPTEVWSFLPEDLTDLLTPRIERVAGRYITEYKCWLDEREAYQYLRGERDILTVYDGDVERVQCFWHMRGQIVMPGTTP